MYNTHMPQGAETEINFTNDPTSGTASAFITDVPAVGWDLLKRVVEHAVFGSVPTEITAYKGGRSHRLELHTADCLSPDMRRDQIDDATNLLEAAQHVLIYTGNFPTGNQQKRT